MRFAMNKNYERILATHGVEAFCPNCYSPVIAKCGEINIHHWSHLSNKDCDDWYEPESEWHREWKDYFPLENQEVIMGNHRADIKFNGLVIELQNSTISSVEIQERERFYKNMIWIVNGESFVQNFEIYESMDFETFKWKHARKCWNVAKMPVYIDMGNNLLFRIKKMYNCRPCRGWGITTGKGHLLEKFNA